MVTTHVVGYQLMPVRRSPVERQDGFLVLLPGAAARRVSAPRGASEGRVGGSDAEYGLPMTAALDGIFDAHGGLDYWRSLSSLDVEMSARGFLFTAKRVAPQSHARLTIDVREPRVVLHDYPAAGHRAVLHGGRRVEILDGAGAVLDARSNPRQAFSHGRLLHWDAIDFAYFCGYAMWNYLTLPFLLARPGVTANAPEPQAAGTRLRVTYPDDIPTHSPTQDLYFDESGRLLRHDYIAEVVGSWAGAAHLCRDYRRFGELLLPTTRRVYPRGPFGRPLPLPTLVAIDIHHVEPRAASDR